jgi:hypothetical protein
VVSERIINKSDIFGDDAPGAAEQDLRRLAGMGRSRHGVSEIERQASILSLHCFHGVYADLVEDVHQLLLLFVDPAVVVVDR